MSVFWWSDFVIPDADDVAALLGEDVEAGGLQFGS